jgi:hypothetical protein
MSDVYPLHQNYSANGAVSVSKGPLIMTKRTYALMGIAAAIALSPTLAIAGTYRDHSNRHISQQQRVTVRSAAGRAAFGMDYSPSVTDPNSPAATGGGSLGYNRKLLID